MSSAAQIAANKNNAQQSTGPVSAAGKAKSSLNAVKTGLTGRTVLLPGDDAAPTKPTSPASSQDTSPRRLKSTISFSLWPTPNGASFVFRHSKWVSMLSAGSNSLISIPKKIPKSAST